MALILNEEQQLLKDSARDFFRESSPVAALRALREKGEEWSPELWSSMAEMGWTGIAVPEEHGGLGFGYVGAGLLLEEAGRTLAASPLLSSALVCASLVTALGNESQKQSLLPAIASGELILALALNESTRLDPSATAMSATADGQGHVLGGRKVHVIDGAIAKAYLVVARTGGAPGEPDGLSIFVVDRDAKGLTASHDRDLDNRLVTDLRLDAVRLGPESLLGKPGSAWEALQRALDIGAACQAAELLGISNEAFERTLGYLKERKQFGVPIGSFQALQHRAALLFCELELSRSAVLKALQAIDADSADRSTLASVAKAKTGKTAQLAVNEAVQMHGGIGMTDEFDIGFFMKRAAAARQDYGDHYYHVDRFAQLRGY
jgi:alkylation response protein AidB-like acyl-CoA dehydrogenase